MHENSPPLSVSELENLGTTPEIYISPEELLAVENILNCPIVDSSSQIVDSAGKAEICPEAPSCSGGDLDIYDYDESCLSSIFSGCYPPFEYPSLSSIIEESPSPLAGAESERVPECPSLPITPDPAKSFPDVLPPPPLPPPQAYPQQGMAQSFYGLERFLYMETGVSGLYMQPYPQQLTAEMGFPNMVPAIYNPHNFALQPNVYGSNVHVQLHNEFDMRNWEQQNRSGMKINYDNRAFCSSSSSSSIPPLLPDISTLHESPFKVGCLTPEEKRKKILKFLKKRNERNYTKKIKYTCRKTLADRRPRVRGRFAKNEECGEAARTSTGRHDYENGNEVVAKDEELYDSSDILAHITGVNSFKHNSNSEPWMM